MSKIIFVPSEKEFYAIFGKKDLQDNLFYKEYDFHKFVVIVTGIGKVNAAVGALSALKRFEFAQEVFLMGIAGAYRESDLSIGEIVSVRYDYFVDEALFCKDNNLKMLNEIGFSVCPGNKTVFKVYNGIKKVDSNTVSLLSGNDSLAGVYRSKTGADIENMEGAAFGLVANKLGITSYQIRSISNYCGDRDKQKWGIDLAVKSLKSFVQSLL